MRKWTQQEESYLINNASQTNAEIGRVLNRSEDSVARKRSRMKLPNSTIQVPIEKVIENEKRKNDKNH